MALVFIDYIVWHFSVAPYNIFYILQNYLIATHQRFLIGTHLRTLFSPWHRQDPSKIGHKTSPSFLEKIADVIIDFYIRILGAIVRLSVIIFGLLWEVVILAAFVVFFAVWMLWPLLSIFLFFKGFTLLF